MEKVSQSVLYVCVATCIIFFNNGCWKTIEKITDKYYERPSAPVNKNILDMPFLIPIPQPQNHNSEEKDTKSSDENIFL